jgi:hypothetical protein
VEKLRVVVLENTPKDEVCFSAIRLLELVRLRDEVVII